MRHFIKLAEGINVRPLLWAITRQPHLWNTDRYRTTFENTPHGEVDDIVLRFTQRSEDSEGKTVWGDVEEWKPAIHALPEVKPIVVDLMREVGAFSLDRLVITRLAPGKHILPHTDDQGYAVEPSRSRYHVVLQGVEGSLYRTGPEVVCMKTGEVWWFDPTVEHEIHNQSQEDRVHLLVDVRVFPC